MPAHTQGELKIDTTADAVQITSRILCDTKVVSAMLYNANYSFEFLIKIHTQWPQRLCAQLLIFSFLVFGPWTVCECVRDVYVSVICQTINIAFYGIDSTHIIISYTQFVCVCVWLIASHNKEVTRGEDRCERFTYTGHFVYFPTFNTFATYGNYARRFRTH